MARVKHLWDFLIQCPRPIPDVGYHMRFKFARSNDNTTAVNLLAALREKEMVIREMTQIIYATADAMRRIQTYEDFAQLTETLDRTAQIAKEYMDPK